MTASNAALLRDEPTARGRTRSASSSSRRHLVLLTFFVAFSFAAIVTVAAASHYHTYNDVNHGFVHGNSNFDGAVHARVDSNPYFGEKYCAAYLGNSLVSSESVAAGNTATCNSYSGDWPVSDECLSAYVYQAGRVSDHFHYAHNYTGYVC